MDRSNENQIDLSVTGLQRVPRHLGPERASQITQLRLDENDLQKLEFMNQFPAVQELSASRNRLLRMYSIASLKNLVRLDLSYNKIICIEGLKDLVHLCYLDLSHNRIKEIDHLNTNLELLYLDLSDNIIGSITNLSQLRNLKKLYLHKNQIALLKHCEFYLPPSLETLTLEDNKITDLNEISHLMALVNLKEISITSNPCVNMTGQNIGFDYRPFLINWITSLTIIDGYAVDEIESLKGEWLYSQGKGRQFRPGQHDQLVQYLSGALLFSSLPLRSDHDKKLQHILTKAYQHQSKLHIAGAPVMAGKLYEEAHLMSRSLDPSLLEGFQHRPSTCPALSRSLHCTSVSAENGTESNPQEVAAPLPAATKLVPVPESLVSPMVANLPDISMPTSSSKFDEMSSCHLQTILSKAEEKKAKQSVTETGIFKTSTTICDDVPSSHLQNVTAKSQESTEWGSVDTFVPHKTPISLAEIDETQEHATSDKNAVNANVSDNGLSTIPEQFHTHIEDSAGNLTDVSIPDGALIKTKTYANSTAREQAATCIQKYWRGFSVRKLNMDVTNFYQNVQSKRLLKLSENLQKMSNDIKEIRRTQENDHRLHVLQMQAFSAFWNKIQNLQVNVQDLYNFTGRVPVVSTSVATQTDITALLAASAEIIPPPFNRPSSLPLSMPEEPQPHNALNLPEGNLVTSLLNNIPCEDNPMQNSQDANI